MPVTDYLTSNAHPSYMMTDQRLHDLAVGKHGERAGDIMLIAANGDIAELSRMPLRAALVPRASAPDRASHRAMLLQRPPPRPYTAPSIAGQVSPHATAVRMRRR